MAVGSCIQLEEVSGDGPLANALLQCEGSSFWASQVED